jgi:hypothetical protein
MDGSQAVKPGVAGGADGDQEPRLADTRLAVMDVEFGVPAPQLAHRYRSRSSTRSRFPPK